MFMLASHVLIDMLSRSNKMVEGWNNKGQRGSPETTYIKTSDYFSAMQNLMRHFICIGSGDPQLALALLAGYANERKVFYEIEESIDDVIRNLETLEDTAAYLVEEFRSYNPEAQDRLNDADPHNKWNSLLLVYTSIAREGESGKPKSLLPSDNVTLELLSEVDEAHFRASVFSLLVLWGFKNKAEAREMFIVEARETLMVAAREEQPELRDYRFDDLSVEEQASASQTVSSLVDTIYKIIHDRITEIQDNNIGPLPEIPDTLRKHPSIAPHLRSNAPGGSLG